MGPPLPQTDITLPSSGGLWLGSGVVVRDGLGGMCMALGPHLSRLRVYHHLNEPALGL